MIVEMANPENVLSVQPMGLLDPSDGRFTALETMVGLTVSFG
jgi:hypothetical protein